MLDFNIPTFFWVIVNLLVLYLILKWILFKPVTQLMDNRTESIKNALEGADKARREASELRDGFNEQVKAAKSEADKIINEARARAGKEYETIIAAAKKDAEAVMEKAREEMERERAQLIKEVRNQVATLALAAASKVIEANMDTERNRELVDKFVDEAGAA